MLSDVPRPLDFFYRRSMTDFAEFVWYTRQNVRSSIVSRGKYIPLRDGYYKKEGLLKFLDSHIK